MPTEPKTLGASIDGLYRLRERRLTLDKRSAKLKEEEATLRAKILKQLRKERASKASGRLATASIKFETIANVIDWPALHEHIRKTKSFELLQRRVAVAAFRERIDDGKEVPGIQAEQKVGLSLTVSRR